MIIYQNYHKHDYYSNVVTPDSPVSPKDYAIRAKELGHGILSSLAHGWTGRYIETIELAKNYELKPVIGAEVYFVKDRFEKDKTNSHLVLIAKNESGRRGIIGAISEANLTGFYYRARIDDNLLFSLPKNDVIITTACVAGIWKRDDADELAAKLHDYFGNNFFLEVQCHNTDSQKQINTRILNLSNKLNIPIIFGADSHYIYPQQSRDRDDYLLSKNIVYEDESGWYMDYASGQTVVERFEQQGVLTHSQIDEAINNTNVLLSVEDYDARVFNKVVKLPSIYPNKTQDEKNEIFSKLILDSWEVEKKNVPQNNWKKYEHEISNEMKVVIDTKMADYFMLDYAVVKRGKELGGHITMTGRGSAPSFYISKLLGFTTIDRISASVKLFPERFITTERILEAGTLPDIDFNLGNPEVFAQAQIDILGENHSYPMLAFGTMRPKAAWKLYARAKNVDFLTANNISEQIEKFEMDLKHADEDEQPDILDYIDKEYQQIYLDSKKYLGIISDWKIHPCAYLLYDGDIKSEIGLIKIKSGNVEHVVSLMDGLWAEQYKFLKNDLLKVSVVDLIYRIYDRIGIKPHPLPELIKLCNGDKSVWDVYANAWTYGINQAEQKGSKGRVARYKPQNISELSAWIAGIRPGFASNYKQFESREPFSYGVPSLDKLIQTKEFPYSYMLYQENAMQVLAYAGIPISVTYEVVKNIAKKRVEKVLKYHETFVKGMIEKLLSEGNTQEEAEKIADMTWQIIEDSSRYSFNSSHAYSVAGDSLYGAYLKSHYPLEFYEVFLGLLEESGEKDRLSEAKQEAESAYKIKFPPFRFRQDNRKISANSEKREITSSLGSIKGFGEAIGKSMYEMSQDQYSDFVDFLVALEEKGGLSTKIADLIKIDYFSEFGNNKKLFDIYTEFTKGASKYSRKHIEKTKSKRILELKEKFQNLTNERFPFWEQLQYESEILGYLQATYPVSKKYLYVQSLNEQYAPRFQGYSLSTGKIASLKVQKKIYENNIFRGGDILYCRSFKKKPSVKMVDGKFQEIEGEYTWWLESYDLVDPDKFDKNFEFEKDN